MEKYMTVEDVAPILHLHPESIRRLCRKNKINYGRSGHRFVFTEDQVQAYVDLNGSGTMRKKALKKLEGK